jgi:hypothetical protein
MTPDSVPPEDLNHAVLGRLDRLEALNTSVASPQISESLLSPGP